MLINCSSLQESRLLILVHLIPNNIENWSRKMVKEVIIDTFYLKLQMLPATSLLESSPFSKIAAALTRYVQGGPKKVSLRSLHITSNTGRFSKFFHCHILQKICNKVIIKYSTSPQTCRYTTLWNIYVRILVNQWNLSHHFVSQSWNITNICNIPDQCCW